MKLPRRLPLTAQPTQTPQTTAQALEPRITVAEIEEFAAKLEIVAGETRRQPACATKRHGRTNDRKRGE